MKIGFAAVVAVALAFSRHRKRLIDMGVNCQPLE